MKISKIKIEGYIFEKDEGDTSWTCRNHNMMAGDVEDINHIMPRLKQIEKILDSPLPKKENK